MIDNDHENRSSKSQGQSGQSQDGRNHKSRRSVLQNIIAKTSSSVALLNTAAMWNQNPSNALAATQEEPLLLSSSPSPSITHKVNINVRISRADGTFYVRDDPPGTIPTPDNQVFYGTITIGLYGALAPNHVAKFLQYADNPNPFDDNPLPSYSKSSFTTFDQSNGLLTGGVIPGLHFTNSFNGASALEYGGRISPVSLWIDSNNSNNNKKVSHNRKGLITHRNLEVLPNFGILTRGATELDASHTVFGELLPTESSDAFLDRIVDLPTYSNTRPVSVTTTTAAAAATTTAPAATSDFNRESAVGGAASSFYSYQKELFRSAAKTFGDTRIDNIYEGKILRRVEVTSLSIDTLST